ncbi:MAG TPA: DUF3300 domain-containing protein [Burkholderiales bacterium]|nr:DUF3300 domain-containing protein [Burkholderiales bacterium]
MPWPWRAAVLIAGVVGRSIAQPTSQPPAAAATYTQWTSAQLDRLRAPIALYPDPLLGWILATSLQPGAPGGLAM